MYGAKGESLGPATHYYRKSGGADAVGGHPAMKGRAEISLERISEDRYRIDYRQQASLKFFLPRIDPGAAADVVLANSAGGIAGGDHSMVRGAVGTDAGSNATTCTPGAWNLGRMLQAAGAFPMNLGFWGKGNASRPEPLVEQVHGGACGLKLHEDWGTLRPRSTPVWGSATSRTCRS